MQNDHAPGKRETAIATSTGKETLAECTPAKEDVQGIKSPGSAEQDQYVFGRGADGSSEVNSDEETRPPLPPRPSNLTIVRDTQSKNIGLTPNKTVSGRPSLQSTATTAISRTDIQTQSFQDGSQETYASTAKPMPAQKSLSPFGSSRRSKNVSGAQTAETASVASFTPTVGKGGESESLLGDVFGIAQDLPTWQLLGADDSYPEHPSESYELEDIEIGPDFYREFDAVESLAESPQTEGIQDSFPVEPIS